MTREVARRTGLRISFFVAAIVSAALVGLLVGARCPAPGPQGGGLVEFGARDHGAGIQSEEALGVNPLFTWAELEPREGEFDWRPLDRVLETAYANGKRVVLRVYTNASDFHAATPQWVFDAGAQSYVWAEGSGTRQPIPTDPVFTEKFARFVAALGQRYNAHPALEMVQTNAAMGGYGEMIWGLQPSDNPPGWSPAVQINTTRAWLDRWRAAFPDSPLSLTVNFIGNGIAETLAQDAVDQGFYLQSNTPRLAPQMVDILRHHAGRTKVIVEIENNGCQGAQGDEFAALVGDLFATGVPVDYLSVCGQTLRDSRAVGAALAGLRK